MVQLDQLELQEGWDVRASRVPAEAWAHLEREDDLDSLDTKEKREDQDLLDNLEC